MPCLACAASALKCLVTSTEVARTAGLCVPNIRYAISETPMRLFYVSSSILRNQPAHTRRISSLQLSQIPGFGSALSPVQDPRRRKEPSHRNSNASKIGAQVPTMMHESSGGAAQVAKPSVPLRSRRDSINFQGFPKPQPSPKNEASLDQDWLKEVGESGRPLSSRSKESTCEGNPRSSKFAGLSRKDPLHEYSSKTVKGSKRAMRSSRSTKATADSQSGEQNYKDQREPWQTQKRALSEKFGPCGWSPRKRLSPDTLEGIRALHVQYPDKFTTPVLADHFRVSPEAIRRILKSKWRPRDEEEERRRQRWERRGENIWSQMVEVGIKPPKKWRDMGVGKSGEKEPIRNEQLEPQKKSRSKSKEISTLLGHSTTILRTISANGHENGYPVPLADRIV